MNNPNYTEALHKVAKLLRLAKSDNPNEAALAASRAQEIIDRFKIEAAALALDGAAPEEPIQDYGDDPLEYLTRKATWKARLANVIARHNGCKMYNNYNGPAVIGRPSDVAAVRSLYSWLRQEVDRLALRDCKGNGMIWANNYRLGIVDTISNRLHDQKRDTEAALRKETQRTEQTTEVNRLALLRINTAIIKVEQQRQQVEAWTKENVKLGKGRPSYFRDNHSARTAGQRAGHEIRMQPVKGKLT